MRVLGNVIWLIFAGLWLAIGWFLAALLSFVLIITIPFGIAAVRIGIFTLWPFGRTVVKKPTHGVMSTIGNVLWFFIGGWWLVLLHIVTGVLLCLSVIGIPFGLANFKLIKVSLTPLGRDIVSVEEARSTGGGGTVSFPAQPGSPSA